MGRTYLSAAGIALFLIWAAPLAAQDLHSVSGSIGSTHGGLPIAGAIVTIGAVRTVSGPEGRFSIGTLPNRTHRLTVSAAGYQPSAFSFSLTSSMPTVIDLGLVTLELLPPVSIRLRGMVSDSNSGKPVNEAELFVNGVAVGVTGPSGGFRADLQLQPGLHLILIRSLGHRVAGYELDVTAAGTIEMDVALSPARFVLPGITVTETAGFSGRLAGFLQRMESEIGQFLTPGDIERISPTILNTSDLLTRVPGVAIRPSARGNVITLTRCGRPELFLDGVPAEAPLIDGLVALDHLVAVEVYSDPGRIPPQFNRMQPRRGVTNYGACGVIVLWTKTGPRNQ